MLSDYPEGLCVTYSQELVREVSQSLFHYTSPDACNKIMPMLIAGDSRLWMALKAIHFNDLATACKNEALAYIAEQSRHR
jgi:hypothetical protein